jgi:pimeloyl-ACP methyl ester carboxylesterase
MTALEPRQVGDLTYYRAGTEGTYLVLLNALGQGIDPWTRLVDRLLPRRLLVWELRGVDPPDPTLTLDDHAKDLAAVLAAERVTSCHLVGWCTGPKLALRYLREHGNGVRSMVFLNPAFKHPDREVDADTAYERNLEALCRGVDRRPETADVLKNMFQPKGPSDLRKPFTSGPALVAYARQHLDFWSRQADTPPVDVPILVVAAADDEVVSAAGARLPGARYTEIAGAGHHALFEHPDRVAGLVEGFVLAADPS